MTSFIHNVKLQTILSDNEWEGTPLHKNGSFVNEEFPFLHKFSDVIKWKKKKNPFAEIKKNEIVNLKIEDAELFFKSTKDGIMWLGHACFFIRLKGINILIDPVWHSLPFVKKLSPITNYIDQICDLDYLLISHDHRDHCDKKTIQSLVKKFPNIKIKTGLRMDSLLYSWIPRTTSVECAGWYQRYNLDHDFELCFLPSRHWSKRGLTDTNYRLWGGFFIRNKHQSIYISGDTGYGSHFLKAAEIFKKIDVAIIGIGAYEPRWFMHANHISPEDAITAFQDLGADVFIPMHFGMYDLSDEPANQPLELLIKSADSLNITHKINPLSIGGVYFF